MRHKTPIIRLCLATRPLKRICNGHLRNHQRQNWQGLLAVLLPLVRTKVKWCLRGRTLQRAHSRWWHFHLSLEEICWNTDFGRMVLDCNFWIGSGCSFAAERSMTWFTSRTTSATLVASARWDKEIRSWTRQNQVWWSPPALPSLIEFVWDCF